MAWDDPSPRTRPVSSSSRRLADLAEVPISQGRRVFRLALAAIVGMLACAIARAALAAWHGGAAHASGFDILLTTAVGWIAAALAWRYLKNRRSQYGLSERVRDGRSWGSSVDDGGIVDNLVVGQAVADLVEVAIDVVADL